MQDAIGLKGGTAVGGLWTGAGYLIVAFLGLLAFAEELVASLPGLTHTRRNANED
jgi:hypothetical protein